MQLVSFHSFVLVIVSLKWSNGVHRGTCNSDTRFPRGWETVCIFFYPFLNRDNYLLWIKFCD